MKTVLVTVFWHLTQKKPALRLAKIKKRRSLTSWGRGSHSKKSSAEKRTIPFAGLTPKSS
ncbi:MAG: hypothetical protein IE913_06420 [Halothiobacillus sp.]|nr:hypothetical protein [Halothiobacillus sp.]